MSCQRSPYFFLFKTGGARLRDSVSAGASCRDRIVLLQPYLGNEKVIELARRKISPEDDPPPDGGGKPDSEESPSESANAGTILMDATCAPEDIQYPTDLNLVNSETVIAIMILTANLIRWEQEATRILFLSFLAISSSINVEKKRLPGGRYRRLRFSKP